MKIIFLDVDGVLNTFGYVLDKIENPNRDVENGSTLNLNALENLYNIVMETDAFIVITSEWRRVPNLMKELMKIGIILLKVFLLIVIMIIEIKKIFQALSFKMKY